MGQIISRSFAFSLLFFPLASIASNIQSQFQKDLERNFAAAIILTDSDVLTFGFHDFDPNDWFDLKNENIGTEDSINLRKKIAVTILPYTFDLSDDDAVNKHQISVRLSSLAVDQNVEIDSNYSDDRHRELVAGLGVEYEYIQALNEDWSMNWGIGTHIQYYRSRYEYGSEVLDPIKDIVDGVIVNTSAWATVIEPNIEFKYEQPKDWGKWTFKSRLNYFYGFGWGDANNGHIGNPEGWFVSNGIAAFYDFDQWGRAVQSVYSSIRRVDIGGDASTPFGTSHYYEGSIGWLMTPPFETDLIDNVGIGLNINYGSNLKGGSIILFFNQD